jgi:hypothetical protein
MSVGVVIFHRLIVPPAHAKSQLGQSTQEGERLPRGIAGDVYPSMPYNSSRDAG